MSARNEKQRRHEESAKQNAGGSKPASSKSFRELALTAVYNTPEYLLAPKRYSGVRLYLLTPNRYSGVCNSSMSGRVIVPRLPGRYLSRCWHTAVERNNSPPGR